MKKVGNLVADKEVIDQGRLTALPRPRASDPERREQAQVLDEVLAVAGSPGGGFHHIQVDVVADGFAYAAARGGVVGEMRDALGERGQLLFEMSRGLASARTEGTLVLRTDRGVHGPFEAEQRRRPVDDLAQELFQFKTAEVGDVVLGGAVMPLISSSQS